MKIAFLFIFLFSLIHSLGYGAIPPPPGCGFDEYTWELVVYAKKVTPLSKKEKFNCGMKQPFQVEFELIRVLKGKGGKLRNSWTQRFMDYDYQEKYGCSGGPTDYTFAQGEYYRVFLHKDEKGFPWYCNHYLTHSISTAEYEKYGIWQK